MRFRVAGSIAAALLSVFFWRNGRTLRNALISIDLPAAYFVGGDAQTQCHIIKDKSSKNLMFCEDAAFWDVSDRKGIHERRLLVSCDPHRKAWNTVMGPLRDPSRRGALWVYAPQAKQRLVEVAMDNYPREADFHPLGIDLLPGPSPRDPSHLIVVNHRRQNTTVEEFLLSPTAPYRATYVRTLTSPLFVSPNAVAYTSPSSFYVSQDHRFTRRLPGMIGKTLPVIESLLLPGLAWVDHVSIGPDSQLDVVHAVQGIPFPNGVAVTKDGKKVAVASSSHGAVRFYNRTSDNTLELADIVHLPFSPDNVGFDDDERLIVAGHPNFPALTAVAAQSRQHAPSWVVSIVPRLRPLSASEAQREHDKAPYPLSRRVPNSRTHEITTLYQSDGTGFSTSTTGLWDVQSGIFYAAGLYQEGILSCQS